ncbi:hypothetical protein N7E81_08070 [Reichenbachiella carrageenanivorans]|uniref:Uncharacterized protein n=1 Tax=Reichenbachiella carrageenanivorans TaxID=2979869 RepID=A0ABY6D583_9BACT|nr:hypothetical protein [Reichenbachiella carrageenanivorans]UXX81054.1 hypothetical protein N7E81_08070 [Reichenbachiella carrageenanivorans]
MKAISKTVVAFLVMLSSIQYSIGGNIIDTNDYAYWRQLAVSSPMFAAMKTSALSIAIEDGETRDVMGGNALAYILDPGNKADYIANIQHKFVTRIQTMTIGTGAATSSVPSHELFHALLALDVIRYDLDPEVLSTYEGWLESKIMKLVIGKWDPHGWAMRMLWYKYRGDEANFQKAKEEFDIGLSEHYMADDGVSPAGNGYCVQRWNSVERAAKNTTPDIMEYMGYNEYYTNPGMIGLHEFMFGYAVSPFGRILLYGDSRDTEAQKPWDVSENTILSPTIVSAARFSPEAYKYAMWVLREGAGVSNGILVGYLSNYLIMAGTAANNKPITFDTADAELAPSRLFENYAALITNEQSTDALYLSMLNLTGNTEYHTHYETNAIAMAGYGEILLRNAGYDGPNRAATVEGVTATFDFMHSDSESASTLMIGGKRHSTKVGDGIVEGIVGQAVEYFRGANSKSVKGVHLRDVVFVQPSNGVNGYYLVMDHVTADNAEDQVNVMWHPNAGTLNIIKNEAEYFSEIKMESGAVGPRLYTNNEATLTTLLGTAPASVEIKRTANQARSGYAYAADYLYVNYNTVNHKADILTVLFPGDNTHDTGSMARIASGVYSGSEITQGQVVDVALTSDGTAVGGYDTEAFQGQNIWYRKASGLFISYFVKGTSFDDGQTIRSGFEAQESVALYMDTTENSGMVASEGTTVTFYSSGISAVLLNGKSARALASGTNWMQVEIPSGTFTIELSVVSSDSPDTY